MKKALFIVVLSMNAVMGSLSALAAPVDYASVSALRHLGFAEDYTTLQGTLSCADSGACSLTALDSRAMEIVHPSSSIQGAYRNGKRRITVEARIFDNRIVEIKEFQSL